MNSSDAAEQIIRMSLEGTEFALKIFGNVSKNFLVALYAISKDTKKTKGKTTLKKLLKSEKELKIFTIKEKELHLFQREAKKYGILYTVLIDKKNKDGVVDIFTRAEDAARINRIVKRFKLSCFDEVAVKSDVVNSKENYEILDNDSKSLKDIVNDIMSSSKEAADNISIKELAKDIMSPMNKEHSTLEDMYFQELVQEEFDVKNDNFFLNQEEKSQLENLSKSKNNVKTGKSIREKLKYIKEEMSKSDSKKLKKEKNQTKISRRNGERKKKNAR